jgi:hypothetical protein
MENGEELGARWMRAMRRGDWDAAWAASDAVLAARGGQRDWSLPRHLQPVWDGTPLAGRRVLVRCYHGLGDTIMCARFLAPLQAIAAEVTVWAQPALIPLLRTLRPAPRLIPLHDGAPDIAFDADIEIMELAHAFRPTPATLPARVPYLHIPAAAPQPRGVGLVWRAGDWAPERSIPPALLRPLAEIEGIALQMLQRGPARHEPALGPDAGSDDVLEAAQIMRGLRLVISVDSMPAHLAGALGVPAWTLLAQPADWRWMEHRADTPWYPTMRLFRQRSPGDWAPVIAEVAAALRALPAQGDACA